MLGIIAGLESGTIPNTVRGRESTRLEGPTDLTVRIGSTIRSVHWFKVEPGRYSSAFGPAFTFDVPPSAVILAPFRLVRSKDTGKITAKNLDESDRQFAGRELTSHLNFPLWSGRDFFGFGTLRPEIAAETIRYSVDISSNTTQTEIYLNDVLAGIAPLNLSLSGGKHRILLRSKGYEDEVYYVRLEGDAVIEAQMKPAAAEDLSADGEQYQTLVGPFVSLETADNQLSRLFSDTLLLTLEEDPRLAPLPSALPWIQRNSLVHLDFLALEESGADLVVSGFFERNRDNLIVQANLYDVQAETIRAAVTWYGTAGLDIFEAMDQITDEFAREVDRVLPKAGRALVTRRETVFSGMDRNEGEISRKIILANRWRNNPNVLILRGGLEGLFENYTVSSGASTRTTSRNGPAFPVTLSWDRDISNNFAAGAGLSLAPTSIRQEYTSGSEEEEPAFDMAIFGGPRLVFRSLRSDISVDVNLQFRYSPEYTYIWQDTGTQSADAGPFLYMQLPLEISFRYYLNKRTDTMPLFLTGSIRISPVGYRFDLYGRNHEGWVDSNFSMNFGAGIRL